MKVIRIITVIIAFVCYYTLNYLDQGSLMLIYKWQPEPFGWAMLSGFLALFIVSKLSSPEPIAAINLFFERLDQSSDEDKQSELDAGKFGQALILLDLPGWLKASRRKNFINRYREDWIGFLLAWLFVIGLIIMSWSIIQIGK